jgi:hypothetical protein
MKQIKTITDRLAHAAAFDAAVNKAIEEGWTLTERKVLQPPAQPTDGVHLYSMLYAELERFTEPDECEDSPFCNLVENCARFIGNLADRNAENDPVRTCTNCKHVSCNIDEPPCCDCRILRHWEPKTCQK